MGGGPLYTGGKSTTTLEGDEAGESVLVVVVTVVPSAGDRDALTPYPLFEFARRGVFDVVFVMAEVRGTETGGWARE